MSRAGTSDDAAATFARDVGPVFIPSPAVIADAQLLLRGLRLPLDVLGGSVADVSPGTSLTAEQARLRVDAELSQQLVENRGGLIAREDARPIALLTELSIEADEGPTAVVRATLASAMARLCPAPLKPPGLQGDDPVVVVADRPPLLADVEQLRALSQDAPVVLVVPVGGSSRDRLPAWTLLQLSYLALADLPAPRRVYVAPVQLFRRDTATDEALDREVARAIGATDVTPMREGADDWGRLLAALDRDDPLPPLATPPMLRELRRWRPPRSRRGVVVLLTGLSGAGKSTLARELAAHIRDTTERTVSLLDGDLVRRLLTSGLGFDRASRDLNVRRNGFVAAEIARHGGIAILALIAPYAESRAAVRGMVEEVGDFVLVHVHVPLAEAERRDVKGLYARARAGLVENFTGISDPYEVPTDADITIDSSVIPIDESLAQIVRFLEERGSLPHLPGGE